MNNKLIKTLTQLNYSPDVIKTQEQFNAVPKQEGRTYIIDSTERITIDVPEELSIITLGKASVEALSRVRVQAFDMSHVIVTGSSIVEAVDESEISAFGSAFVSAYDKANVYAFSSAYVHIFESATACASDNAIVVAHGFSEVFASDATEVIAREQSMVTLYNRAIATMHDEATAIAYDTSYVKAMGSTHVTAFDRAIVDTAEEATATAHNYARVFVNKASGEINCKDMSDCIILDNKSLEAFIEYYGVQQQGDFITLYIDDSATTELAKSCAYAFVSYNKQLAHVKGNIMKEIDVNIKDITSVDIKYGTVTYRR